MSPESIFSACSSIALFGWIILIFLPFWSGADKFIIGIIIVLFSIVYTWLLITAFSPSDISKYNSLAGVKDLFANDYMLTAGWVHYLAFDLLAGVFIKKNSLKYNLHHLLIVPCLFCTFMFGPAGFLLYIIIRTIKTRKYFASIV